MFRRVNPWDEELSPEVRLQPRARGGGLRPLSAPAGGKVAVCPHCWGLNLSGDRLCGRCGADMSLLLQESGGLRRTPAVQSPVPVRVAQRLGVLTRAVLLLLTAVLALAWLIVPLLGGGRAVVRMHRQSGRVGEAVRGGNSIPHSPTPPLSPSAPRRYAPAAF